MDLREDETEKYLKEFHPREVRTLESTPDRRKGYTRFLAVAAGVLISVGALAWFHSHTATHLMPARGPAPLSADVSGNRQYRNTMSLTSLALTDDKEFEQVLLEKSQKSLARFEDPKSMLKVLTKE